MFKNAKKLVDLEGLANEEFRRYAKTFYWLEEIRDLEGFSRYCDEVEREFVINH